MIEPTAPDFGRVDALIELGRFQDALQAVQQILAREPHSARGFCLLAQCWLELGEPEAARRAAETAVGIDPERAWPHRLLSLALQQLDRRKEAVAAAREAVRLNANDWLGHVQLAFLLAGSKRTHRQAQAAAAEALRLAPTHREAHLAAARVALSRRRRKEAQQAVERALALDPENSTAHNMLATVRWRRSRWLRGGTLAEAADGYAAAIRTDPHSRTGRHNLDALLRTFLARLAYFVLLDAWLTRGAVNSATSGPRLLPALLLLIPIVFASRFTYRLSPPLRSYLVGLALHTRLVIPVVLMTVAAGAIAIGPFAAAGQRQGFIAVGGCAALVARIYLLMHIHTKQREFTGKRGFFANDALWFIAVVSGLGAVGCLFLRPLVFGLVWVTLLGTFSALSFNSLYRRRHPRQRPLVTPDPERGLPPS